MLESIKDKICQRVYNSIAKDNFILPKSQITYANDLLYTYHNADFIKEKKFSNVYNTVKSIGGKLLKDYDIQWRIRVITYFANAVKHLDVILLTVA